MLFWTKEEYLKFSEVMKDKPVSYYAFEVLYWTGIREGELLALERGNFNIEDRKLTINFTSICKVKIILPALKRKRAIVLLSCRSFSVGRWKIISECFTNAMSIQDYSHFPKAIYTMRWTGVQRRQE